MIMIHLILVVVPPPLLHIRMLHCHYQQSPALRFLPPPTTGHSLPPATAPTTVVLCCCCHHRPRVQRGHTACPVGSWFDGATCHGVTAEDMPGMLCLVCFSSLFLLLFSHPPILFNLRHQRMLLFLSLSHSFVFLLSFPIATFFCQATLFCCRTSQVA